MYEKLRLICASIFFKFEAGLMIRHVMVTSVVCVFLLLRVYHRLLTSPSIQKGVWASLYVSLECSSAPQP